jgi:hypothetical protein
MAKTYMNLVFLASCSYLGPTGDRELAVACWWRAAAAQALSAYVLGVMGKGLTQQPAAQVCLVELKASASNHGVAGLL